MKMAWALLFVIVLFAGRASARNVRRPRNFPNVSEVIVSLEARRFKAMTEGDLVTLGRILGDGLIYTHTSGWTQSKPEFLESIRSGKLRYLSIEPANERVQSYGSTAIGTGRAAVKVSLDGKVSNFQFRFMDVYMKRAGRWQLVGWQATRLNP